MRLIDADAIYPWYINSFSEEVCGDKKITPNEIRFSMNDIRGNLDNIPTIELEQARWIPVSEGLPEVNQRVLVTSYGRVCYAMLTSVDGNSGYPIFRLQDKLNERVVCETTVHSEFTTGRIIAWMPLPEAYVPQERSDKE